MLSVEVNPNKHSFTTLDGVEDVTMLLGAGVELLLLPNPPIFTFIFLLVQWWCHPIGYCVIGIDTKNVIFFNIDVDKNSS